MAMKAARRNNKNRTSKTKCMGDEAFADLNPAIDDKDFNSFSVPLPPLPEQERISAYLNTSCVAIDAAVTAKRRQLETLDELRKATIRHAVTKGLNPEAKTRDSGVEWFEGIPNHWNCEHLKRFAARIQTGATPPTDRPDYYLDGSIPWFAPGSYNGDITGQRRITEADLKHAQIHA